MLLNLQPSISCRVVRLPTGWCWITVIVYALVNHLQVRLGHQIASVCVPLRHQCRRKSLAVGGKTIRLLPCVHHFDTSVALLSSLHARIRRAARSYLIGTVIASPPDASWSGLPSSSRCRDWQPLQLRLYHRASGVERSATFAVATVLSSSRCRAIGNLCSCDCTVKQQVS